MANEEKRFQLAVELEKQRAEQQQKLEEFRDKRQNARDLLFILSKIADRVLDADKNSVVISAQMTQPNMQKEINAFGALVEKIEFLWQQNGFLLDATFGNSIQKIFRTSLNMKSGARCLMRIIPF